MSIVGRTMWEHIRSGEVPTKDRITAVAGAEAAVLGERSAGELGQRWTAEVLGGGLLQPLLDEPDVTDVLVNGPGQVWIDRGDGLQPVDLNLGDEDAVRRLAVRLAAIAGRRLDDASPWVDGQLPGGVRLHAMLPPLVSDGPHLSLRIPRRTGIGLSQLCARGLTDALGERLLTALVEQKVAFVVTGGTGSGKTTLLSSMLALVSAAERLLVVEDVREMIVEHPHVVRLESRPPNVEGAGEVTLAALVRQALRMRPDRVVVGEVRGAEVRELMSALNTGHEGGCGTLHANSPVDVISRFEALGALGGMAPSAVRSQLASSVRVVVHVQRTPAGRRLAQVGVIGVDEGELRVRPALRWEAGQAVPMEGLSALESVLGRAVR